ncbi:hypothetical protein HRbin40_00340 [bacterium HR40]|nr:hypothetical protein HRbin40_00340 [bacterium HR40]
MTGPKSHSKLVRFLLRHALLGIAFGWTLLALLLYADLFGLAGLVRTSDHGWLAVALLAFGFAVTFGSAAMGTAVFLLEREEEGEDRDP